jgi:hypothetical protein
LETLETTTLEGHQLNLNQKQKEDKSTECQIEMCDREIQAVEMIAEHIQTSPIPKSNKLIRRSGSIDESIQSENRIAQSNPSSKQAHVIHLKIKPA